MPKVTVAGTTLHYVDVGAGGPPVLLLHAVPFHAGVWEPHI